MDFVHQLIGWIMLPVFILAFLAKGHGVNPESIVKPYCSAIGVIALGLFNLLGQVLMVTIQAGGEVLRACFSHIPQLKKFHRAEGPNENDIHIRIVEEEE